MEKLGCLILAVFLLIGCAAEQPPKTTPTIPPAPTSQVAAELAATSEGLSIDEFFEVSFRELMLRNPELVVEVGLTGDGSAGLSAQKPRSL